MFLDQNFTLQLNFKPTFGKTRPRLPSENEQKTPILEIFRTISPKQAWWPPNFFSTNFSYDLIQLHVQKIIENSEC